MCELETVRSRRCAFTVASAFLSPKPRQARIAALSESRVIHSGPVNAARQGRIYPLKKGPASGRLRQGQGPNRRFHSTELLPVLPTTGQNGVAHQRDRPFSLMVTIDGLASCSKRRPQSRIRPTNAVWTYEGKEVRSVFKSSPNRNGLRIKLRTCGALIASAIISWL
jgi:hypothetical protein